MPDNENVLEPIRELGRELTTLSNRFAAMDTTLEHLSRAVDDSREEHQRHVHELRSRVREIEQGAAVKHENIDVKVQLLNRTVDQMQLVATDARDTAKAHEVRIRGLERYLWMGMGALAILNVALKLIKWP